MRSPRAAVLSRPLRAVALAATLAAPLAACGDAAVPPRQPALETRGLEGELTPFAVQGQVRVGTCNPAGGTTLRAISGALLGAKDTHVPAYGLAGTVAFVANDTTTPELNDSHYTMQLQRDVAGVLVPYMFYAPAYNSPAAGFNYQSGTRSLRHNYGTFMAPAAGTDTLTVDLTDDHLATMVVTAIGDPDDDITSFVISFSSPTAGAAGFAGGQRAGTDPSTVAGFVSTTDAATHRETVTADLLIVPNAAYTYSATITFADGLSSTVTGSLTADQLTPCGKATVNLVASRGAQILKGKMWLRSGEAAGVGPHATEYFPEFARFTDNVPPPANARLGWVPVQTTFRKAAADESYTYLYDGVPAGRYRFESPVNTGGPSGTRIELGHVHLAWPGRSPVSPSFPAEFRFPFLTPSLALDTQSNLTSGVDLDGFAYLSTDETETFDLIADMAYLRGKVDFAGCIDHSDITAASAEISGRDAGAGVSFRDEKNVLRTSITGNVGGFARGLFAPKTATYEVAASAGPWTEGAYRFKLDHGTAGAADFYDGTLNIRPAASDRFNVVLAAGRAAIVDAPERLYPTGRVTVHMSVKNADGSKRPFKLPVLAIGADTGNEVAFNDLVTGAARGTYWATSTGSATKATDHFVPIIGLAKSQAIIIPTATVPANPDGTGAESVSTFPPLELALDSGGCGDVCIDLSAATPVVYHDDGQPPAITVTNDPILAGATDAPLTVRASDQVPVVILRIDGVEVPLQPGPGAQTATRNIHLTGDATIVTIVATDLCGKTSTVTHVLTRCGCGAVNACQIATCQPDGRCLITTRPDGSACDDGDACTTESCRTGACVAAPIAPAGACDSSDSDLCARGHFECFAGTVSCVETDIDRAEACNGQDDDCDGQTDEDFPLGTPCVVGLGVCAVTGHMVCAEDSVQCDAVAKAPGIESCNGKDDDCDGVIDDAEVGAATSSICPVLETEVTAGPDAFTASSDATFTFIDPTTPTRTTFECKLDAAVAWQACDGGAFTTTGVTPGVHVFYVRSVGGDGARDASPATRTWERDIRVPDTLIVKRPADPAQDTTADFTFACVDAREPCTFECALTSEGSQGADVFVPCTKSTQYTDLSEARHTLKVRATSATGIVDPTPATWSWTIDTSNPETRIVLAPAERTDEHEAHFTFDDPSDAATVQFQCRLDAAAGGDWQRCDSGAADFTGLALGLHHFEVASIDAAGHIDPTPAEHVWRVLPPAPDTAITEGPTVLGRGADAHFTYDAPGAPTLTTFDCSNDGGLTWTACDGGATTIDGTAFAVGANRFDVRACLREANPGDGDVCDPTPASWTFTVTAELCPGDTDAPSLTCVPSVTLACHAVADPATFATATDPCDPVVIGWNAPETYVPGANAVQLYAHDGNNNRATCTTIVEVPTLFECGDDDDADGIGNDVDPCTDVDHDGFGVGPNCLGADCDDHLAGCTNDCVSDRNGADGNGVPDCAESCDDPDGDGFGVGRSCYGNDCNEGEAACNTDCSDFDLDLTPNCLDSDDDNDGLGDLDEVTGGTDPHNPDTDGDGLLDGNEVHDLGTDPKNDDTDDDGISDPDEALYGTDPTKADTDGDGAKDADEIRAGTDPLDPKDFPGAGAKTKTTAAAGCSSAGGDLSTLWVVLGLLGLGRVRRIFGRRIFGRRIFGRRIFGRRI